MSRSQEPRTLAALAATVFAAALVPVLGAGTASATTAECNAATVQYRIVGEDGNVVGADWTSQGGFLQWTTVPGTVQVRLAPGQTVADGCTYPVSLAEYTTEGPNWYTSGHQTMVDKASVYLTKDDLAGADDKGRTWQKLSVKSPDCYGQIDLYGDDISYDGKTGTGHGPLPYQPGNVNTPYHLIAAWNGGDKECTPGTPETPTPSETPPTTPATPTTPAGSTPPVDTPPTTPAPSTTPPTTPDVPPMTTPPNTPEPKSSPSGPPLAETGSSAPVGAIAGGAAAVVAIGAGALYMGRRTRRS